MWPVIAIGPLALATYPLLLLVGLWAGLWLAARRAGQLGLDPDDVYNAGFYGLIAGLVGARLWFVLVHWEHYASHLGQILSLSRSALAVGEGLLIAGLAMLVYLQRHNVPLGHFLDALAPGLALWLAIGHVGAFLGGVGLGLPTTLPWAIEMAGAARHPVQLYQAGAGLLILAALYKQHQWRPWPGFQFWLLVALYGLSRLLLEIFYARPALVGDGYLQMQVIYLAAIVVALAVMSYNFKQEQD